MRRGREGDSGLYPQPWMVQSFQSFPSKNSLSDPVKMELDALKGYPVDGYLSGRGQLRLRRVPGQTSRLRLATACPAVETDHRQLPRGSSQRLSTLASN